ncbi:MAG: glycosyltransferase family 1 protein [Terriglobia bacterium]
MKVVINAASAKMGGAVTYITNVLRCLPGPESGYEFEVFLPPETARGQVGLARNVHLLVTNIGHASWWKRLWWEQITLRSHLRKTAAGLLFSTGNFGMFRCPVRQVLLVCNALYFSKIYREVFVPRHTWRVRAAFRLRRWLVRRSAESCDVVMTPTQALLDDLRPEAKLGKAVVNPYGVAEEDFTGCGKRLQNCHSERSEESGPVHFQEDTQSAILRFAQNDSERAQDDNRGTIFSSLSPQTVEGASPAPGGGCSSVIRLVFVSLYAEHKNLATLLEAIRLLNRDGGRKFLLKTTVNPAWKDAAWTTTYRDDLALAGQTGVAPWVEFVGPFDRAEALRLYREADIFVFPSLVESFGHPLAEAMAAGLPIAAADTPVNREVCGSAAVYFQPLSPEDLARKVGRLAADPPLRQSLGVAGYRRAAAAPGWDEHVRRVLEAAKVPHLRQGRNMQALSF